MAGLKYLVRGRRIHSRREDMPDPEKKWTKEQLESDDVTKKQIVEEVQVFLRIGL